MDIKLLYDTAVINLPRESLIRCSDKASAVDFRILLYAAIHPDAFATSDAAAALCISEEDVIRSLCFWEKEGVIQLGSKKSLVVSADKAEQKASPKNKTAVIEKEELPEYSSEEMSAIIDGSAALSSLISACQQAVGKIFTVPEVRIIVGLYDFLKLSDEYILSLCAWCVGRGKTSLRYIEKTAVALYNRGIDSAAALNEHLKSIEVYESEESKIRRLFGIGDRTLTSYEKKHLQNWIREWKMPTELIEYAYELTVKNTQKASIPYAGKILEGWHQMKITSVDEARAAAENKRSLPTANGHSFDISEFSKAAMNRKTTKDKGEE